jgi:hypothetical protein
MRVVGPVAATVVGHVAETATEARAVACAVRNEFYRVAVHRAIATGDALSLTASRLYAFEILFYVVIVVAIVTILLEVEFMPTLVGAHVIDGVAMVITQRLLGVVSVVL